MPLQGKRIFITGASRGIGWECARLVGQAGARVALASRPSQALEKAGRDLQSVGAEVLTLPCDVGVEDEVVRAFARVREAWQGLDGLVNCAAVFEKALVRQMSLATWQSVLQVNLTGTFLCCREAFRIMDAGGAIVNVASLSGVPGVEKFPGFAAYNVSKYGVVGLTEILAVEGASLGLRVNCVSPGAVDTSMLKQAAPQLPPVMHPREVAPVVVFLLSEASGVVNGANLVLHGSPHVGPEGKAAS